MREKSVLPSGMRPDGVKMKSIAMFEKNYPRMDIVYDYKHQGSDETLTPGTVWLRVYFGRTQRKYISTGVRVLPSQWSDTHWVVGHPSSYQLNNMIREQVEKAIRMVNESMSERGYMPTTKAMKVDRSDASFLDFVEKHIKLAKVTDDTRKHHMTLYTMLSEYGKMRKFDQVTKHNILAFLQWISQKEVIHSRRDGTSYTMPVKQSTIHDYWKRLRKYIRIAQEDLLIPAHVTLGIKVDKGEEPERERLTDEEMEAWLNTKQILPCLEMARLRFIVQMGTGLAYRDLVSKDFTKCEKIDGQTVLVDKRTKTKEGFFCVVLPFAVEVLEQWEWKVPYISHSDYNRFLDRVALNCGIEKHITSHVARHTYACYCLRHGVRIEAVKRALGHKKLETTQIYARLADMDVLEEFKKIK